jgi:8-oxo-dGTP pyrophosphatase MutT (NUDIX family)
MVKARLAGEIMRAWPSLWGGPGDEQGAEEVVMTNAPSWLKAHGTPWSRGRPRLAYENPWLTVTEYDAVAPTGRPAFYGVVGFKNVATAILPIYDDGSILLVGQHRFPFADYSWEVPEGGAPKAEDPLEGAKRELREEAGLLAAEWREVLRLQLSNSVTDEAAVGYIATRLSDAPDGPAPEETEALAIVRPPFREALDAAVAGHLKDALTVAMLLRAYHMAREDALPGDLAGAMLG